MTLPPPLENRMHQLAKTLLGKEELPVNVRPVSGGSINDAASFLLAGMELFIKWNDNALYPGMFEAEAQGLRLLGSTETVHVPKVIDTGEAGNLGYLVLENILHGYATDQGWDRFGQELAELHRNSSESFGLDHDNYMGSLTQSNKAHGTWCEFFILERLVPQLRIARDEGSLSGNDSSSFERLFKNLPSILPEEPPALVHGDLWSGNYLTGTGEKTYLIDPAVAYGHREVDIAMSRLFGGFPHKFYQAYNYHSPLEPGWEARIEIFQLYPLLIHVNLFGGSYVSSVRSIIKRF